MTGDGNSNQAEQSLSFHQSLAAIRAETGYSLAECAEITRHPLKTFENWSSGHRCPTLEIQKKALADLRSPINPPSKRTINQVKKNQHLIWDKSKGWECRISLKLRGKEKAKRVRTRLSTRDLNRALIGKEAILEFTKQLGLEVVGRSYKRRKHLIDGKTLAP